MLDIIRSEFYKVRKSKVTFVTALCLLGIAGLQIAVFLYAKIKGGVWMEMLEGTRGLDVYFAFANVTFYLVFVALFVGGMISNEYTNRTVRQVVSRGASRIKIALGQYIALSVTMTVISVVPAALSGLVASIIWEFGMLSAGRFALTLLGQILLIWSYSAITMLIAHLARSGGLSIGVNFMMLLGGSVAAMFLTTFTKNDFFNTYWLTNIQFEALNYTSTVASQGKFVVLLFLIGAVFTILSLVRFKIRDVD